MNMCNSRYTSIILVFFLLLLPINVMAVPLRGGDSAINEISERDSGEAASETAPRAAITADARAAKFQRHEVKEFTGKSMITGRTVTIPSMMPTFTIRQIVGADETDAPAYEVKRPEAAECYSARTETYKESLFDCSEGISRIDEKATGLNAEMGKNYAYVETTIKLDINSPSHILRIIHDEEFPKAQNTNVFVRDAETNNWKLGCANLEEGAVLCDISSVTRNRESVDLRIENYAKEGESVWEVNSVSILNKNTKAKENTEDTNTEEAIFSGPANVQLSDNLNVDIFDDLRVNGFYSRAKKTTGVIITNTNQQTVAGTAGVLFTNDLPILFLEEEEIPEATEEVTAIEQTTPQEAEGNLDLEGEPAGSTPDTLFDTTQNPITGAAIANFLDNNRAGVGLGLFVLVAFGLYGRYHYKSRKGFRK